MSVSSTSNRRRTVSSVSKAAVVLKFLRNRPGSTSGGVALELGLDRTTVHRLLLTLAEHDLVHRSGSTWQLGTAAIGLGGAYVDQSLLRRLALPYAIDLQRTLAQQQGVVSIDVWAGTEMIVLERVWNRRTPLSLILGVGSRVGITGTASGLAVLARLPQERLSTIPGATAPDTVAAIERTRALDGVAVISRGVLPGLSAMAAAITDGQGQPVGSLVIAGVGIAPQLDTSDMAVSLRRASQKASFELAHERRPSR